MPAPVSVPSRRRRQLAVGAMCIALVVGLLVVETGALKGVAPATSTGAPGAPSEQLADRPCCFSDRPLCEYSWSSYTSCVVANGTRIYCCIPCSDPNPVCTTTTTTMTTTTTTSTTTCAPIVWLAPPVGMDVTFMQAYKKVPYMLDVQTGWYRYGFSTIPDGITVVERIRVGTLAWRCGQSTTTTTMITTTTTTTDD